MKVRRSPCFFRLPLPETICASGPLTTDRVSRHVAGMTSVSGLLVEEASKDDGAGGEGGAGGAGGAGGGAGGAGAAPQLRSASRARRACR
ncbi:hypothetical protein GWK89_04670 [Gluconobacter kondonii]|nr:hypothetical protein [Gluconobacter kondonii]